MLGREYLFIQNDVECENSTELAIKLSRKNDLEVVMDLKETQEQDKDEMQQDYPNMKHDRKERQKIIQHLLHDIFHFTTVQ